MSRGARCSRYLVTQYAEAEVIYVYAIKPSGVEHRVLVVERNPTLRVFGWAYSFVCGWWLKDFRKLPKGITPTVNNTDWVPAALAAGAVLCSGDPHY